MAAKCLISYRCRNKISGAISYGMTLENSHMSFLRWVRKLQSEEYVIINIIQLTEEEAQEIFEKGLYL